MMEKLVVIGPYTRQMKESLEKYLPAGVEMQYITEYSQYGVLKDADYIILRTLRLEQPQIQQLNRARLIQRWGAGYDTVDIEAAGRKEIQVAVGAGVNAQSVAEMAVLLMLAVYRCLPAQAEAYAAGLDRRTELIARARCIEGKTVGILGMGNIGRKTARLLQGFGAEILYYDVYPLDAARQKELGCRYAALDEVLAQSDIISLHLPLLDSTRHIMDKTAISKMKTGAILINTARQELVEEESLAQALKSGKLLGAGLDEIGEPFADSPFAAMENVICTPHIGGSTVDINDVMARICMEHLETVRQGKRIAPPSLVNGKYLDERKDVKKL